jgi:hypothetical protein
MRCRGVTGAAEDRTQREATPIRALTWARSLPAGLRPVTRAGWKVPAYRQGMGAQQVPVSSGRDFMRSAAPPPGGVERRKCGRIFRKQRPVVPKFPKALATTVSTQAHRNLWPDALRHLLGKRSAVVGLFMLIGLAAIALLAPALATDDPIQPLSGINRRSALTSGGVASAWDEEWPAEIREGARNHAHGWAGGLSRMALSARAVMGDVVD